MARSFGRPADEEPDDSSWLETYADAITLLMAFFVLLYAMSDVDKDKFKTLSEAMRHVLAGERTHHAPLVASQIREVTESLREQLAEELDGGAVRVRKIPNGIELEFNNSTLFRAGSAQLRDAISPKLRQVGNYLKTLPTTRYKIEVEGHTDDVPIKTPRYPDNWELSAARATAVVRFMQRTGVSGAAMKAVGLSDTRPKRPNTMPDGTGLPLNRAQNRRVTVQIIQY